MGSVDLVTVHDVGGSQVHGKKTIVADYSRGSLSSSEKGYANALLLRLNLPKSR